jgi:UDP-2-acetamido-3-amino-2,3-dideoxy-glucuronate N-acetyltransferase
VACVEPKERNEPNKHRGADVVNNIAVIGCGQWGKNLVRNLADLGVLRVMCDVDSNQLAPLRERFSDVKLTTSFSEILKDDDVAGIMIATPAGSHYALAKEALLAGKDVFVEKPLALKVADGRDLVELADKKRRILMVGHLLRYHPAVSKLKELIDEGKLGKLCYIYSNRLNLGRFRTEENILWSFAPHDISAMLYLLGERPTQVFAQGGSYLNQGIPDVTVTMFEFQNGVRGHIFVSWLHPYKEQKFVVVGDRQMAVFDDVEAERKLVLFKHAVEWVGRVPVARMEHGEAVPFPQEEPLLAECRHFLECIATRRKPDTDGEEGLRVLEVLEACQESLDRKSATIALPKPASKPYFVHETAAIDEPCEIGEGTRIWHFSHVMKNARIGRKCSIGQNVFIASDVVVGDNVKIQNNVSLYTGVIVEDDVFCGPSMVFTNVINPRSHIERKSEYLRTLVKKGASLGANCTIVCGITIGRYGFIGAGAVVAKDVPDYALVVGVPGRVVAWMCHCGIKLSFAPSGEAGVQRAQCGTCGTRYEKQGEIVAEEMPVGTPGR